MQGIDEHLYWRKKCLVFTWHIKDELEKVKLDHYDVLKILDSGVHIKVAKRQNKFNVYHM